MRGKATTRGKFVTNHVVHVACPLGLFPWADAGLGHREGGGGAGGGGAGGGRGAFVGMYDLQDTIGTSTWRPGGRMLARALDAPGSLPAPSRELP